MKVERKEKRETGEKKKVKRWEVKRNEKIEAQPPAMMMKRNVSGCLSTAPCCTEC